jgi:hypothetical protein
MSNAKERISNNLAFYEVKYFVLSIEFGEIIGVLKIPMVCVFARQNYGIDDDNKSLKNFL